MSTKDIGDVGRSVVQHTEEKQTEIILYFKYKLLVGRQTKNRNPFPHFIVNLRKNDLADCPGLLVLGNSMAGLNLYFMAIIIVVVMMMMVVVEDVLIK
jgi:hypothetical protein